ncbi:radical SAM protein [Gordoniibacillus kamchatkensis]|uniref:Radical SAM protein n=1 Tax=Gordoniibacillus kamchatkensis TaxID=1590651 RepID=A0ABR5A820_9BACL|nr:radical SAM protein [Paenibacillus sp. VKM B-2647]
MEYEPITSKSILNQVSAPSMPFRWSINPYRGCQHGCSFCYARSTHSFLGIAADDTFQNHIFLKSNAVEALEGQLRKMSRSRGGLRGLDYVAIGTATDPYQPVEANAKLTRGCLEVLAKYGVSVSLTTRSPLILRDLDLLSNMSVCSINISINTLDKKVWKALEPSTPSPMKRLETVQALSEAGITAGVFMAPILPHLTDRLEDLEELVRLTAQHRASFCLGARFLRLSTSEVKVWFFETLRQHYPHLVAKYAALFSGSGYTPKHYREPIEAAIGRMLNQHGLDSKDALRREKLVAAEEEAEPVQLSFSF